MLTVQPYSIFVRIVILNKLDAYVHSTHLNVVLVLCIVLHHLLVPPLCTYTKFVHFVMLSSFDVYVQFTLSGDPFSIVPLTCASLT